jgi:hypothetical protein
MRPLNALTGPRRCPQRYWWTKPRHVPETTWNTPDALEFGLRAHGSSWLSLHAMYRAWSVETPSLGATH